MKPPLRWGAAGLAALAAAGASYAVAGGPADDEPAAGEAADVQSAARGPADVQSSAPGSARVLPAVRETPYQGLVARLPHIGTLTWRCDDQRRFFTELTLETPGASVTAGLTSDGQTVFRGRRVDPLPRRGTAPPDPSRHA